MFCKNCGASIQGAKFCPSCGHPAEVAQEVQPHVLPHAVQEGTQPMPPANPIQHLSEGARAHLVDWVKKTTSCVRIEDYIKNHKSRLPFYFVVAGAVLLTIPAPIIGTGFGALLGLLVSRAFAEPLACIKWNNKEQKFTLPIDAFSSLDLVNLTEYLLYIFEPYGFTDFRHDDPGNLLGMIGHDTIHTLHFTVNNKVVIRIIVPKTKETGEYYCVQALGLTTKGLLKMFDDAMKYRTLYGVHGIVSEAVEYFLANYQLESSKAMAE